MIYSFKHHHTDLSGQFYPTPRTYAGKLFFRKQQSRNSIAATNTISSSTSTVAIPANPVSSIIATVSSPALTVVTPNPALTVKTPDPIPAAVAPAPAPIPAATPDPALTVAAPVKTPDPIPAAVTPAPAPDPIPAAVAPAPAPIPAAAPDPALTVTAPVKTPDPISAAVAPATTPTPTLAAVVASPTVSVSVDPLLNPTGGYTSTGNPSLSIATNNLPTTGTAIISTGVSPVLAGVNTAGEVSLISGSASLTPTNLVNSGIAIDPLLNCAGKNVGLLNIPSFCDRSHHYHHCH